jgi:hypothetical protein
MDPPFDVPSLHPITSLISEEVYKPGYGHFDSLVDPGYAGLDEMIFFEQIVGIEGEPGYALSSTSDGLCTSR